MNNLVNPTGSKLLVVIATLLCQGQNKNKIYDTVGYKLLSPEELVYSCSEQILEKLVLINWLVDICFKEKKMRKKKMLLKENRNIIWF